MNALTYEWRGTEEPPEVSTRILVWHRVRPWCRFFKPVVGWWNGKEWLSYEGNVAKPIYQPQFWKYIESPNGGRA